MYLHILFNYLDEEPPKVTCPSAKTEQIVDAEIWSFVLKPAEVVVSDNLDPSPTVMFSPESLTISAAYIGITREITVTVTDRRGLKDQCKVQVYTAGKQITRTLYMFIRKIK